jgi:hypothetical protein
MGVKFEFLSDNLITVMTQLTTNQNLCKYLTYYTGNPLTQPNIPNPQTLIRTKIYPYPFVIPAQTVDTCQINVYYPSAKIDKRVIQHERITFDVVCHQDIWLLNDGNSAIRPYRVATEVMRVFDEKPLSGLGVVRFDRFQHLIFNDVYHAVSLSAEIVQGSSANAGW